MLHSGAFYGWENELCWCNSHQWVIRFGVNSTPADILQGWEMAEKLTTRFLMTLESRQTFDLICEDAMSILRLWS